MRAFDSPHAFAGACVRAAIIFVTVGLVGFIELHYALPLAALLLSFAALAWLAGAEVLDDPVVDADPGAHDAAHDGAAVGVSLALGDPAPTTVSRPIELGDPAATTVSRPIELGDPAASTISRPIELRGPIDSASSTGGADVADATAPPDTADTANATGPVATTNTVTSIDPADVVDAVGPTGMASLAGTTGSTSTANTSDATIAGGAANITRAADTTRPAGTVAHTFRLPAAVGAEQVWLVGDFNGWSHTADPMERIGDWFTRTVELEGGRAHRYRYLLDGVRWENDWAADAYVPNDHGSEDSVVSA